LTWIAGDFAFDPLGLGKKDLDKLKVNELKNGRLAMMAFSGIVTQAAMGHSTFPCKLNRHSDLTLTTVD
jgi:Chlorophyll A-B binding protein